MATTSLSQVSAATYRGMGTPVPHTPLHSLVYDTQLSQFLPPDAEMRTWVQVVSFGG